jgi:hypothetical protein
MHSYILFNKEYDLEFKSIYTCFLESFKFRVQIS